MLKKTDLLELEENAHLSINELREKNSKLVALFDERLEKRVRRTIASQLAGGSDTLRKLVDRIRIRVDEPESVKLRRAATRALREAVASDPQLAGDKDLAKELDGLEESAATTTISTAKPDVTIADAMRLNDPIAFHPEFRRELDAAKLYRLSDATGLEDKTAALLIQELGKPANITGERLEALVQDQKLSRAKADAAGLAASLYNVLDERPELVAAVNEDVKDVRDLVEYDTATWAKRIKTSKTNTPGDIAIDAYAELLAGKVKRLFPTAALSKRLKLVNISDGLKQNAKLNELRERNAGVPLVGARDFEGLNTEGLAATEIEKLLTAWRETVGLANRFSGMKLAELLDDDSLSDAVRANEVGRRADLVNDFFASNADVLGTDLAPGSTETKGLKFVADASDEDKTMVLATARTYQRALTVTDNITHAEALVVGGFPSALSVAMSQPNKFAARTGLEPAIAARYHDKAKHIATAVTAHAGTILDLLAGRFADTAVGNVSTNIGGYLKEVPGFADFFGNQNFCHCKHCQSILGPAAYFVDLMCFVDESVTQQFFATKPDHPLNLKNRTINSNWLEFWEL